MNRRNFLTNAALFATAAATMDPLEILDRLTHKKVWALGGMPGRWISIGNGWYRRDGEHTDSYWKPVGPEALMLVDRRAFRDWNPAVPDPFRREIKVYRPHETLHYVTLLGR